MHRPQRTQHHGELVDQPLSVGVHEIAALNRQVADAGTEHQRVIIVGLRADLTLEGEILENAGHQVDNVGHHLPAAVRPVSNGAVEHDILGEKLTDPFQLTRLYGTTKCEHVNLLPSAAHLRRHR